MERSANRDHALKGDTRDPLWIVGADRGVANVVVWLRPVTTTHFEVPVDLASRNDVVTVHQPFLMFEPHIVAINPSRWDPTSNRQQPTGQIFKVLNDAPTNCNVFCRGNGLINPGKNVILPPGQEMQFSAVPCRKNMAGRKELLTLSSDIHRWMSAKVAVFDHPYYAITDMNGIFEIRNAPVGAELMIAVWHESFGPLNQARMDKITLKAGDNRKDFKIK
jgi:hypothetical protein